MNDYASVGIPFVTLSEGMGLNVVLNQNFQSYDNHGSHLQKAGSCPPEALAVLIVVLSQRADALPAVLSRWVAMCIACHHLD